MWHLFVVRSADRNSLQKHLEIDNIQTLIHYPVPPHKQQAYKEWNHFSFPLTEQIHDEVLSLPISPVMKDDEVKEVVRCMNLFNS